MDVKQITCKSNGNGVKRGHPKFVLALGSSTFNPRSMVLCIIGEEAQSV